MNKKLIVIVFFLNINSKTGAIFSKNRSVSWFFFWYGNIDLFLDLQASWPFSPNIWIFASFRRFHSTFFRCKTLSFWVEQSFKEFWRRICEFVVERSFRKDWHYLYTENSQSAELSRIQISVLSSKFNQFLCAFSTKFLRS